MRLEVFTGGEVEKVIRLRLFQEGSRVILAAVDETGIKLPQGNLLEFYDGVAYTFNGIHKTVGLNLTETGALVIVNR